MATYILNKYQAVKFYLDPHFYNVLIRITSPGDEFLQLEHPEIYRDKLELKFYDIIKEDTGLSIFQDYHLKSLLDFFELHKFCENMIIHCDEGMSRSAGIAVGWFLFKDTKSSIYKIYHDKKHIPNRRIVEFFYKRFKESLNSIDKWEKEKLSKN